MNDSLNLKLQHFENATFPLTSMVTLAENCQKKPLQIVIFFNENKENIKFTFFYLTFK